MGTFERFLTVWVALCIIAGIALGQMMPGVFHVIGDATVAQVNIPEPNIGLYLNGRPADLCGDGHRPSSPAVRSASGRLVAELWPRPSVYCGCPTRRPPSPDPALCDGSRTAH
jgi:hypothetical protein